MKFAGQANLAVQFVEVGIAILMGAPFLPLDPIILNSDSTTITTKGPNVHLVTAAKPAAETTQLSAMMSPLPSKTGSQIDKKSSNHLSPAVHETSDPCKYSPPVRPPQDPSQSEIFDPVGFFPVSGLYPSLASTFPAHYRPLHGLMSLLHAITLIVILA